MLIKVFI